MTGKVVATALVTCLASCNYVTDSFDRNEFSGDPYPIAVSHATPPPRELHGPIPDG